MHFPAVAREGGSNMGGGKGGVVLRMEQELAEAERSGEAGDRQAGRLLTL